MISNQMLSTYRTERDVAKVGIAFDNFKEAIILLNSRKRCDKEAYEAIMRCFEDTNHTRDKLESFMELLSNYKNV